MKLNEFLEKFLPGYYEREDVVLLHNVEWYVKGELDEQERYAKGFRHYSKEQAYLELVVVRDKLFNEALQNYTNEICEKQRENCAEQYRAFGVDCEPALYEAIREISKQPEIK